MIDLQSRVVVGWSMKERPNQELVNEALMMAVKQRRPKPGLIHHSDNLTLTNDGRAFINRYLAEQLKKRSDD